MSESRTPVIFDLDGTLVESVAFDEQCYIDALREVLGNVPFNTSWHAYDHITDSGILSQILREHRIGDDPRIHRQVREVFGRNIRQYLQSGEPCHALRGAKQALALLRESGVMVGIATGGWGHTARMKLEAAGLLYEGLVLASSDDAIERTQIMTACLRHLDPNATVATYVGDAEWDVVASAKLGWTFVGVGARLKGRCPRWIADYGEFSWITS